VRRSLPVFGVLLVAVELAPEAYRPGGRYLAAVGTAAGAVVMLVLAAALGVE
jgi:hypothetical protein